ncbi:P-selectin-like isoform 2-T2 [Anomaloglossus baeobatrachus]|uniref:P-selectin-like isoform X2 n=1 Tax=Anomaloglossus baeobatrachus TaxID=238106 RepID=UPI003F50BCCB
MEYLIHLFLLSCGFPLMYFTHGWTYHSSSYNMKYDDAQKYCRKHYTDMVAIQNKEENKYLDENLPFNPAYYWIGIRKNTNTREWTWVGTKKVLTKEAENWATNEPNNKSENKNEDCVEMYVQRAFDSGKWNDEPCSKKKAALCYTASCNSSSCSNHGECVETINNYTCNCYDGFFGKDCEHVVTCPEIESINNGWVVCSHMYGNFTYQSSCNFTCSDGHLLVGSQNLQCNGTGGWGFQVPRCEVIQCNHPNMLENGVMDCSTDGEILLEKSTCHFSCNEGFTMVGSSSVLCTTPGQWSQNPPKCEAIQCDHPSAPENGAVDCPNNREMLPYNSTCSFICNEGFNLVGNPSIHCVTPGQWSAESPTCEAIKCKRPVEPENNGSMSCVSDQEVLPYNSTCNFSCDEGFTIVGSPSVRCLATAQWTEKPPRCKAVQCQRPEIPQNGAMSCTSSGEKMPEKSICSFECPEEYTLTGPSYVLCTASNQWTGEIPICEPIQCSSLVAPVDGLMECNGGSTYNSTCAFSCSEGHEMTGSSELRCLPSGQWTSAVPLCKAVQCPSLTSPKKGHMNCQDKTNYKSECSFSCLEGFQLVGSPVLTCQSSGAWSSSEPTCEAIHCPTLTDPDDGLMVCSYATNYKTQCSFSCSKGFRLIGSSVLSCQTSGAWTSSVPRCEAVQCNALVAPTMGKMNCSQVNSAFGTVCTFTCEYGLLLIGEDTLECESTGIWNTEVPTCEAVPQSSATNLTVGIVASGASVLSTASLIIWLIKRMRKTAKKFSPTNCQHLESAGIYQNTEDSGGIV